MDRSLPDRADWERSGLDVFQADANRRDPQEAMTDRCTSAIMDDPGMQPAKSSPGGPLMLYAVTIEPLNTIVFMYDRPDDSPWEVEEGVELEINPLFGTLTPDRGPLRQTLCVSISDPRYYRVFLNPKDIHERGFRPTGQHFGGLLPRATWERFVKTAPSMIAVLCRDDDEPLGDAEQALAAIERGG
jgi:hypothetical protein